MFFIIGYQIVQSKAIMRGNKVDTGCRSAIYLYRSELPVIRSQIRPAYFRFRSSNRACYRDIFRSIRPIPPEICLPGNHLAQIQGQQLNLPAIWLILVNNIKKSAQTVYFMQLTSQGSCKIKPKSVNMHFLYPVPKTIHHEAQYIGRFALSVLPVPV